MYPSVLKERIKCLYSRYASGKFENEISISDESLGSTVKQAIKMIKLVLENQQYDFGEVAADIIGNWYFSMVYGRQSIWRDRLLKERQVLVPKLGEFSKNSQKNKEIRDILKNLSSIIVSK